MMKTLLALVGCILAVTPGDSFLFNVGDGGITIDLGILKLELRDLWGFGFKVPTYKNESVVLMQRIDGGTLDFNRGWGDYTNGFQDANGQEFWLGNDKIYNITSKPGANYTLRVEVQVASNSSWYYAEYSSFYLESKDNYYKIHFSGYSGDAGDSLSGADNEYSEYYNHQGMAFSTNDADHDMSGGDCALFYKGGWWFNNCYYCCLTCLGSTAYVWSYSPGLPSSGPLKAARMMIRRNLLVT